MTTAGGERSGSGSVYVPLRDAGSTAFQMRGSDGQHVITTQPIAAPSGGYQSHARCSCGGWSTVQLFGHLALSAARGHLKQVSAP